ncbi:MAG: NAD+ synthase [Pseudomonadota bacterium]
MSEKLKIALAQINLTVGDIIGNSQKIIASIEQARDQHQADLIVFHEQTLCNYSPEDLLYHDDFYEAINQAIIEIAKHSTAIDVVIGFPELANDNNQQQKRFNSAAWLRDGNVIAKYRKQCLPNYAVFDEKRYFTPGNDTVIIDLKGYKIGLLICEDLWHQQPMAKTKQAGAELIVSLNASPFSTQIAKKRLKILQDRVAENNIPIVYVNQLGGHDELLFDGNSMVIDSKGDIAAKLPHCQSALQAVCFEKNKSKCTVARAPTPAKPLAFEALVYQALVLGTGDYVRKNGFKGAVLGLSGGIDSALTLAIAVDALGKENVSALFMPSRYSSKISYEAALAESQALGIDYHVVTMDDIFQQFLPSLKTIFQTDVNDITQQNIQARVRGLLLMAVSNQQRRIVLTTGNKSEMAVGYCTLYGDMAGGFAVLKDVYKTMVYRLANYRNRISPVIPEVVISRPPSAELAPEQKDEDSLPPYDILDQILERYIEKNQGIDEIIAANFDADTVRKVISMLVNNEYKRRQSPPGTRITTKAFGRDWRYPITSRYC